MLDFKKFVDAYAEVYNLQHQDRGLVVENAVRHLANILREIEDFRAILNYIKEFIEHYDNMKEYHLEFEIKMSMDSGYSFFEACEDWDI